MTRTNRTRTLIGLCALILLGIGGNSSGQEAGPPPGAAEGVVQDMQVSDMETMGLIWIQEGNVKRLAYVVQTGDTLWDIARRYLNSPYYWPKIWERNTFVINPHLIFPGDILYIYPDGLVEKPYTAPDRSIPVGPISGPGGTRKEVVYQPAGSTGFLATEEVESAGRIVGNPANIVLLGENQYVYVNVGKADRVEVGDRYSVFRVGEPDVKKSQMVIHPVTGEPFGYKVTQLGEIEITKTYAETSEALIINSFREIHNGDLVTPYLQPLEEKVQVRATEVESLHAYIVTSKDNRKLLGRNDIVYIDRGSEDGVMRGNVFIAYLPCETVVDDVTKQVIRIPEKILGSVLILEPRSKSSVGLIIESYREFSPGTDLFLSRYKTWEIEGVSSPADIDACKSNPECLLIPKEKYDQGFDNPMCEPIDPKYRKTGK